MFWVGDRVPISGDGFVCVRCVSVCVVEGGARTFRRPDVSPTDISPTDISPTTRTFRRQDISPTEIISIEI